MTCVTNFEFFEEIMTIALGKTAECDLKLYIANVRLLITLGWSQFFNSKVS